MVSGMIIKIPRPEGPFIFIQPTGLICAFIHQFKVSFQLLFGGGLVYFLVLMPNFPEGNYVKYHIKTKSGLECKT